MFEKHEKGLNDENLEKRIEELSKHYPKAETTTLLTYDSFVCKNNISVGKFIKNDKLTMDEKREFAQKLNQEWLETVVKPYIRTLCDFCEKYELAIMRTEIGIQAQPMMRLFLEEMGGSALSDKLDEFFDND